MNYCVTCEHKYKCKCDMCPQCDMFRKMDTLYRSTAVAEWKIYIVTILIFVY